MARAQKAFRIAIGVVVAVHFSMLVMGMLRYWLPIKHGARAQYIYARITGAGGTFGFFSPNVPRDIVMTFDLKLADGSVRTTSLQEATSSEIKARLVNMMQLFENQYENEKAIRSIGASLTAAVFRRHPEAVSITMNTDFYSFPTLGEYAEGKRPRLIRIYSAEYINHTVADARF